MSIHVVQGVEADVLLKDRGFRDDWLRLYEQCPWATAFQHPDYATPWYGVYRGRFAPVLVLSRYGDGSPDGLLALAASADGALIVAGGRQAEYHAWICPPDRGDEFARQAIRALRQHFPRAVLTFRYLPPAAPVGWLADAEVARASTLACRRRPLLRFNRPAGTESSLNKKRTRYRLKQLEKVGAIEFRRIDDPAEFEEVVDTVIRYYDFRQEAAHGTAPFRGDALKREFLLARLAHGAVRPHVTVLTVGGRVASAHVGARTGKDVHLGLLAHDPFLAKHSPGKFHLLFLAEMLRGEGCERLDLTPGDDAYKDNFANDCDEVHELTVFLSPRQRAREAVRAGVAEAVKSGLRACRIEPGRVRSLFDGLKGGDPVRAPLRFLRGAGQWVARRGETRVYSIAAADVPDSGADAHVRRDALDELLNYQAAEPGRPRHGFVSTAWARVENGAHVYTCARDGRTLHFGWLSERQEKLFFGEEKREFQLPPGSAYLFDFYTAPDARGQGLFALSLRAMLRDAARAVGTERIFVAVPADNGPARRVVEKAGFIHERSLFEEVRFGRARRWTSVNRVPT